MHIKPTKEMIQFQKMGLINNMRFLCVFFVNFWHDKEFSNIRRLF